MRFPFYGFRKVQAEMRRRGLDVGEHVVRRLLRELGVTRSAGKVRVRTTRLWLFWQLGKCIVTIKL